MVQALHRIWYIRKRSNQDEENVMKKQGNFIEKLATQLKIWTARIDLQDARAEKERAVEIRHGFVNKLKY